MEEEKPDIFYVPPSPLLKKAALFKEMLKKDNEKLLEFIKNGGDPSQISMETLDPNESTYVEMTVYPGIYELKGQETEQVPDVEVPDTEFHHASNYE